MVIFKKMSKAFASASISSIKSNGPLFFFTELVEFAKFYLSKNFAIISNFFNTNKNNLVYKPENTFAVVSRILIAKIIRLLTANVIKSSSTSKGASLSKSLLTIEEGTIKSFLFRTTTAFIFGAGVSYAYRQGGIGALLPGGAFFAVYDGFNAAFYDGIDELKKFKTKRKITSATGVSRIITLDTKLSLFAKNITYLSSIAEGIDGLAKTERFIGAIPSFLAGLLTDHYTFREEKMRVPSISQRIFFFTTAVTALTSLFRSSDDLLAGKSAVVSSSARVVPIATGLMPLVHENTTSASKVTIPRKSKAEMITRERKSRHQPGKFENRGLSGQKEASPAKGYAIV